jgi:beta-phosphoglucomutase-like phosphatase (HAD superfamily)
MLGVAERDAIAVEDSVPGTCSAVAAGLPTIGNLQFVPPAERVVRSQELLDAGAFTVVRSWTEIESILSDVPEPATEAH